MGTKDAYQEKLDARLKEFSIELEKLKAKASVMNADVRLQYERQLAELQSKREHADVKLGEIKHAGEGAWRELRTGAEHAFEELRRGARNAASKFKS
jgi:hypothetical protein